jgi:hypothetical protein
MKLKSDNQLGYGKVGLKYIQASREVDYQHQGSASYSCQPISRPG